MAVVDWLIKGFFADPVAWLGVIMFVMLAIPEVRKLRRMKFRPRNNVHGTAAWATNKMLKAAGMLRKSGIPLGFTWKRGKPFSLPLDKPRHIITLGGTGRGKTSHVIQPELLTCPYSVIVPDIAGELAATCAHWRQRYGKVVANNPFNWRPDLLRGIPQIRYNPMNPGWLNPKEPMFGTRCAKLAQACVWQASADSRERYFYVRATSLLQGIIMAVVKYAPLQERNLRSVAAIVHRDVFGFARWVVSHTGDAEIRDKLASYAAKGAEEVRSLHEVIESLKGEIDFLLEPAIAESMSGSDFTFAACKREVVSVFNILPLEVMDSNVKKMFRVVIGGALGELMRDGGGCTRTKIIADELYLLGRLDAVDQAFAAGRKYNVEMHVCLQDWPQLSEMYGNLAQSFISNAHCVQWLSAKDPMGATMLSAMCGETEVAAYSKSVNYPADGNGRGQMSESLSQGGRRLIMPDEVMRLPDDEQILIVDGVKAPIRAKHKAYYETELRHRARPNPYYAPR